jgi:hypothetical protein
LHHGVQVIRHPTKRVDACLVFLNCLGDDIVKAEAIGFTSEWVDGCYWTQQSISLFAPHPPYRGAEMNYRGQLLRGKRYGYQRHISIQ